MQEKKENGMNLDRAVLAMAGTIVLVSVIMGLIWSKWWFALTLFAGANMLQAAFTGFCPAAIIFQKLGLKSGCAFK